MSLILSKIKKEAIIFCPLCNKEYKPVNMKVVERAEDTMLAHSHCPNCRGAILSLLYSDLMGITLLGLVTDLNYDDALNARNAEAIETEEVLEVYEQLIAEE
jgi:hypothetical protein